MKYSLIGRLPYYTTVVWTHHTVIMHMKSEHVNVWLLLDGSINQNIDTPSLPNTPNLIGVHWYDYSILGFICEAPRASVFQFSSLVSRLLVVGPRKLEFHCAWEVINILEYII